MSLFAKDQVEGQPPQALSVLAQFAEGTDVQFFSVVGSPFSLLPMIKSKSFEIVPTLWVVSLPPGKWE